MSFQINLCAHLFVVEVRKAVIRWHNARHAPVIAAGLVVPGAAVSSAKFAGEKQSSGTGVEMAAIKPKL